MQRPRTTRARGGAAQTGDHAVRRLVLVVLLALATVNTLSCQEPDEPTALRTTLDELLLENARRCDSGFTYPQVLIDGLSTQLIEELQCMEDDLLVFYEPSRDPGGIWPEGPQPLAMRPEVVAALAEAGESIDDFITILAGYRDVAMQYYSRWFKENCRSDFNAAVPGQSNHQGGRAVDVKFYNYWFDILLAHGFEHPIPSDEPHFELRGDEEFRAESERLKRQSVEAFQRLWNRNHPDDPLPENGLYTAATKERLGKSPVEGFSVGACGVIEPPPPDAGQDADSGADAGGDVTTDDAGDDVPVRRDSDTTAATDGAGEDASAGVRDIGRDETAPRPKTLPRFGRMPHSGPFPETKGCAISAGRPTGGGSDVALPLVLLLGLMATRRRARER